jgi:hypothetical protein
MIPVCSGHLFDQHQPAYIEMTVRVVHSPSITWSSQSVPKLRIAAGVSLRLIPMQTYLAGANGEN